MHVSSPAMFFLPLSLSFAACVGAPSSDLGFDSDSDLGETDSGVDDTDDTDDTDAGDTDDSDVSYDLQWDETAWPDDWQDALTIDEAANGGSGVITISMDTVGIGGPAALYLGSTRFTEDWDEEHTLAQASAETDGSASTYERELNCDASAQNQTADVSTLFKCDASSNHFLDGEANQQVTLAVAVWPEDAADMSGTPTDCIVFGHDPTDLLGGSVPAGLNPPSWLTAANCDDVNP